MAKVVNAWDVKVGENVHHVEFKRNKITIDGAEPQALKNFQIEKVTGYKKVAIPLDDETVTLYISTFGEFALVQNGVDLATGRTYDATPLPKWIWVFWGLFIVNFFVVCGGALGAVINMLGAAAVSKIVAKSEYSKGKRIGLAILFYVMFTLIGLFVAYFAYSVLN